MGLMAKYGVTVAPAQPLPIPPGFLWAWPNATARLAQTAVAADVGARGIQVDIARPFQLLGLTGGAPLRWGRPPVSDCLTTRAYIPESGAANHQLRGWAVQINGTYESWPNTAASLAESLPQIRISSTVAVGGWGQINNTIGTGIPSFSGFRMIWEFALRATNPAWRWFIGMGGPVMLSDVNPANTLNMVGIGRGNGEAFVQAYCNDGAGVATQVDMGADFPASDAGTVYTYEIYCPVGGMTYHYNLLNRNNHMEKSGSFVSNIPANNVLLHFQHFVSNGGVAVKNTLGILYTQGGQISV